MCNEELMENELNEVAGGWLHETVAIYAVMRDKGLLQAKDFLTMGSSVADVLVDKFGMEEVRLKGFGANVYLKDGHDHSLSSVLDMVKRYHA